MEDDVTGLELQEEIAASDATLDEIDDQSADDQSEQDVEHHQSEQEEVDEQQSEATPVKKGGVEKKINKLVKQREDERREKEFWKQQALTGQPQTTTATKQPVQDQKPKFANFEDIEAYTEAVADWTLQQADLKRQKEVRNQNETNRLEKFNQRVNDFEKTNPDYREVMADAGNIHASNEVMETIVESPVGPAIAYYLANNVDELERIDSLSPTARLRELGKLEDRLAPANGSTTSKKQTVSKAPAPVNPVAGTKTVAVTRDIYDPNLSMSEYKKLREQQLIAAGKLAPRNMVLKK